MNSLFLLIENFYERLQNGDFDNRPYSLAASLENLADQAWNDVDEWLVQKHETDLQTSLKIE